MKAAIKLADKSWKVCLGLCIFSLCILQKSDVSAVTHNKSSSKSSSPPSRGNTNIRTNHATGMRIPSSILSEIRSLDNHLLCFPKLLCTIYQDDSITKRHAMLNVTELGVAYIKLLKAVHYSSPTASTTTTTTTPSPKVKTPIIQIFKIPSGLITTTYTARKEHLHPYSDDWEDYPQQHLRSPFRYDYKTLDDVDDEYGSQSRHSLRDDDDDEDKEFLREKIEISQMMKELKDEDNAEEDEDSPSNGGFASTLFNSFLPFMGSRSMRTDNAGSRSKWASQRKLKSKRVQTVITQKHNQGKRKVHNQPDAVPQDAFSKAVTLWRSLKTRSQCKQMYKTCPLEAWEVVRMLDLVKDQSKVLSTYLKITVDNVKPTRKTRRT